MTRIGRSARYEACGEGEFAGRRDFSGLSAMCVAIKAETAEQGATLMKGIGKVFGGLCGKYAGRMGFGTASGVVKEMLSG